MPELPDHLQRAYAMVRDGQSGWVSKSNIRDLLKAGLIEAYTNTLYEPDGKPAAVIVTQYRVKE